MSSEFHRRTFFRHIGQPGTPGYSLIDVVVTISIATILVAIAMPNWNARRMNILAARGILLADLRLARTNAITKSIHYQVSFSDQRHVTLSGMVQSPPGSGSWVVDTTKVQTTVLPAGAQIAASSVSVRVEFDTRGLVANSTSLTQITVGDSFGNAKSVQVWPSGQINET